MCNSSVSFKWLDILEKEFDKAFVNIDLLLGDFESDETEILHMIRKKLATMCSCFSQLSHKALTIFQINAKAEAEIVNLKSEIIEMNVRNQLLQKEVHALLIQLHSKQLEELNLSYSDQKENIKGKLQHDLEQYSPIRTSFNELEKTIITLENWKKRLQTENELLRCTIVSLQAEVCGARLAARYLDKELAGRIQQLQLITRDDMNVDVKNKLWVQLDAEILLQRHKTVIKVMRQQYNHSSPPDDIAGRVRSVHLNREPSKGLGISVTGGREHSVPILISELEPWCLDKNLYVGDAILSVNGIDLNQLTHKEAVKILSSQIGHVTLTVITLSTVNINEIEEETNFPLYLSYPFFDDTENHDFQRNNKISNTQTAPRTPPSNSTESVKSSPEKITGEHKQEDINSENELFGITTLQKIFRTVSSIESSQNKMEESKNSASENTSSCCNNTSGNGDEKCKNKCAEAGDNISNKIDIRSEYTRSKVPARFSASVPSDQINHPTSVVSRFGDSNVGTPV